MDCELGVAILNQAVRDWHNLIRAKAWKYSTPVKQMGGIEKLPSPRCNFGELRAFFKGNWCDTILAGTGVHIEGEGILKILEDELAEAMQKDEEREARKR